MNKYRKPDAYYAYEYDRYTIRYLKESEAAEQQELQAVQDEMEKWKITVNHSMNLLSYHGRGVSRARERDREIQRAIREDEEKDRLVNSTRIPQNIQCDTCNTEMMVCNHFFKGDIDDAARILFVFECPNGHFPRKAIYPNGNQYFFPKKTCSDCGHEIKTTTKKTKKYITSIYTCTECGKKTTDKLDLIFPKAEPVTEEDRKKYCVDFIGKSTFLEDLEKLAVLTENIDLRKTEEKENQELGVDKIEKLTIPNMEERLRKIVTEKGYVKFQFEKPAMGRHVVVPFSVQDPSDRSEDKSIKILEKIIKDNLPLTNWRLMTTTGINYRLGYLTGQLKAHEQFEDLKKLAIEINTSYLTKKRK